MKLFGRKEKQQLAETRELPPKEGGESNYYSLEEWKEIREKSDWFRLLNYNTTGALLKELPLFRIEPWFFAMASIAAVFIAILELVGYVPGGALRAVPILLLALWVPYLWKHWKYLPRGNKIIVERNFKSTGVKLSIEKIPGDHLVHFDKNDEIPPVQLTTVKDHFEVASGRPYVRVLQGYWKNVSLIDAMKANLSDRTAKEFNNIIKVTYSTAWQAAMSNVLKSQKLLQNPLFLVMVAATAVMVISVAMQFFVVSQLGELAPAIAQFDAVVIEMRQVVTRAGGFGG